jgi:hypothetical protein
MRSELAKLLKKQFEVEMKAKLPSFHPEKSVAADSLFSCEVAPDLFFYILLFISRKDDRFTIELAWSRHGRFPAELGPMTPRDNPVSKVRKDEPNDGRFRCRLGDLLTRPHDHWWVVVPPLSMADFEAELQAMAEGRMPEELPVDVAKSRISELVRDAVRQIAEYGMPYFAEIAASCGRAPIRTLG